MRNETQVELLMRRYQFANEFQVPVSQIDLKAFLTKQWEIISCECNVDITAILQFMETPLPARWQLLERRVPLPAKTIRCAIASLEGEWIDGHFSRCPFMFIYDVSAEQITIESIRRMPEKPGEMTHQLRVDAINDCQLLFVNAIGGPAAARVIRADIYPMKVTDSSAISHTLLHLRDRLMGEQLPPWLKKLMGQTAVAML